MSTDTAGDEGNWRTPPAEGELSDDGERYSLYWWPRKGTTNRALFRIVTDDGVAVLLHVASWTSRQRGAFRSGHLSNPTLDDIPNPLLGIMKDEGYTPANAGEVEVDD